MPPTASIRLMQSAATNRSAWRWIGPAHGQAYLNMLDHVMYAPLSLLPLFEHVGDAFGTRVELGDLRLRVVQWPTSRQVIVMQDGPRAHLAILRARLSRSYNMLASFAALMLSIWDLGDYDMGQIYSAREVLRSLHAGH